MLKQNKLPPVFIDNPNLEMKNQTPATKDLQNDDIFIGRKGEALDFFDEYPEELIKYAKEKGMIPQEELEKATYENLKTNLNYKHLKSSLSDTEQQLKSNDENVNNYPFNFGYLNKAVQLFIQSIEK